MSYMKFCEQCGKTNAYKLPYCTHCGYQLAMGNTLDYPQAKKNFADYMSAHLDEKIKFDDNHFQICPNCHRKCTLDMDFCGWCGAKLNKVDQYENYRMLMTTANQLTGFQLKNIQIVFESVNPNDDPGETKTQMIAKANNGLLSECKAYHGNTIIGYHLLVNHDGSVIAYGTAVNRTPLKNVPNVPR